MPDLQKKIIEVNHVGAMSMIYCVDDFRLMILNQKDGEHSISMAKNCLNVVGGSFIGEAAKKDKNPLATVTRHLQFKLSLIGERPVDDTVLKELDLIDVVQNRQNKQNIVDVKSADERELAEIKNRIISNTVPFGDYLLTTPAGVINETKPIKVIFSYFTSPVDIKDWQALKRLYAKYETLSSVDEVKIVNFQSILDSGQNFAFGHDIAVRNFLSQGAADLVEMPMVQGVKGEFIGCARDFYQDYFNEFDVLLHP